MGQIQITRRSFSLSGSQLHIQMEVNYEGLQMPSDESLTLTPFLLAGEQSFDLPSILINGAEKQKVYERTRVLGGASDTRNGRNSTPSVVLKNDRKASRRFTYKVTVPFREWMAQADLMLHTEECGCNGREAATYDDRIGRCLKRMPSFFVMLPVYYPFLFLKYLWSSQLLLFEK